MIRRGCADLARSEEEEEEDDEKVAGGRENHSISSVSSVRSKMIVIGVNFLTILIPITMIINISSTEISYWTLFINSLLPFSFSRSL